MKISKINDERAQGVVEFAFIVTMLTLLFVGTVDFARFMYYGSAIRSAARVGAETASNHCAFAAVTLCGQDPTAVADTFVLWSTSCEANNYVNLQPSYSSCSPGNTSSWTPSCAGTCSNCANDICVSPSSRTKGTQLTVSVGYRFHPIAFLLDWVFTEQSCFSGDSPATNHHTLCASSVGRVA